MQNIYLLYIISLLGNLVKEGLGRILLRKKKAQGPACLRSLGHSRIVRGKCLFDSLKDEGVVAHRTSTNIVGETHFGPFDLMADGFAQQLTGC